MGRERYPTAGRLMITADGGGSNGSRVRLFKIGLQKLADDTGLTLQVCRLLPGTSKWNKIEHRLSVALVFSPEVADENSPLRSGLSLSHALWGAARP
jgi:hypothetical protein